MIRELVNRINLIADTKEKWRVELGAGYGERLSIIQVSY